MYNVVCQFLHFRSKNHDLPPSPSLTPPSPLPPPLPLPLPLPPRPRPHFPSPPLLPSPPTQSLVSKFNQTRKKTWKQDFFPS